MSKMTIEGGHQLWRNEAGRFDRNDGPAIIWADGSKQWFIDGVFHREDGPAYIGASGIQSWWFNDIDRTSETLEWIDEMSIEPDHTKWTDKEKIWFKLRFGC